MTVNLHTHTARCGHATGADREYVEAAIQGGLKHLGFADHMPFLFPDGFESHFRIPMKKAEEYMSSLAALREEYKNDISIHIGFEMEYYPRYFKEMKQLAIDLGAEYLLLSQHYINNEYPNGGSYMGRGIHPEEEAVTYADTVLEAMETGLFTYFAHPDLVHYTGTDEALYEREMRRICQGAARCGMPLEINLLGIREGRHYPLTRFWEIAAEEGCEAVLGCDAHSPDVVVDSPSEGVALEMIRGLGLRYNAHPRMIHPLTGAITFTE